jgi:hypothetical protein
MKFEDILTHYRLGRDIRRSAWDRSIESNNINNKNMIFHDTDIIKFDWIVEEPKQKKKVKLYAFVNRDFLHNELNTIFYKTKELTEDYLLIRVPEFDKEIEVEDDN